MKAAKVISLYLSPDMEKEALQAAREERKTVSELLREAFRQYMARRDLSYLRKKGRKTAKRMKLKPGDVAKIVSAGRK